MVFRLVIVSLGIGLVVGLILGTNMGPILSLISKRNLPVLSWYLLDFDVTIPWSELLTLVATLLVASTLSMYCTLRRTRKISPMELFR
jgi:ABC-type antimicrobial peptide transport system permease subunit